MNVQLTAIRTYFAIYSVLAPKKAARKSFVVFQKVRKKDIRPREADFFSTTRHSQIDYDFGKIDCYFLGDETHPLVFLIHGWDSNAGSLSKIAQKLVENNYYVILMNLPGHAFSAENSTNLLECKYAFNALLAKINPTTPFSVISHSFGSAVVSYALSETEFQVDKLIFLTNPNRVEHIFEDFKAQIGLKTKAYQELLRITEEKLREPISEVSVEKKLKKVNFNQLVLIHDKFDKVLAYENSQEVLRAFPSAKMLPFENVGHYKMLWNEAVIDACVRALD